LTGASGAAAADGQAGGGAADHRAGGERGRDADLTPRPFRLVHADVHRKNILDGELALLGDPVYDLAVHLHEMGYLPEEERRAVAGWAEALPAS
jgi:thiamine kinase-like enzyme